MTRVLLVNKFYYHRGGDCIVALATERLLKAKGHAVAVFGMKHPENLPSPWTTYFPDEVSFSDTRLRRRFRAAGRLFRPRAVMDGFSRILDDFRPDVVHLHNIHSYLSPVVAQAAHQRGIRVVWTMHDYKLICPTYACLRDGKPCELCFRRKSAVLSRRCMKGSRAASLLAWMEALYWNRKKVERLVDRFISPSLFLKEKMVSAGFSAAQIEVAPNFVDMHMPVVRTKEDYYCYVGRLSVEKGVEMLLRAAGGLPYRLKVIGGGTMSDYLKKQYPHRHIEFLGQLSHEQLLPIVQRARFSVIPSIWYENNPLGVIESLCLGTPVLGARIGGIPELIEEHVNGLLFEAGNEVELQQKIERLFSMDFNASAIAEDARERYSVERYYQKISSIYHQ